MALPLAVTTRITTQLAPLNHPIIKAQTSQFIEGNGPIMLGKDNTVLDTITDVS